MRPARGRRRGKYLHFAPMLLSFRQFLFIIDICFEIAAGGAHIVIVVIKGHGHYTLEVLNVHGAV